MNEITIIIDCNYLCYVNKFALSKGLAYKGNRTEIIFGFLRHLLELSRQFQTNQFIFCWDSRDSFRKKIYPEYKINRRVDRSEEEIESDKIAYKQFDLLRTYVLPTMGFTNILLRKGYECDDLIASIVKNNLDIKYIVVANDSDLFQLLDYCTLYNISKKRLMTKIIFEREKGIEPNKWGIVKAIMGCSADNIHGVSGVGEKTAIKYLKRETTPKITLKIKNSLEIIRRNMLLVILPFEGIKRLQIIHQQDLSKKGFVTICERFAFNSFLEIKLLQEWIKQFNMK